MSHVLWFRKFSRAKHCIGCVCKGSAHPSMASVVCSDAQQTKYSFECPLTLRRKDKCALLCLRKLGWARHRIYYVCGGPSQQSTTFTVFEALKGKDKYGTIVSPEAQPSKIWHVLCVPNAEPNRVCTFCWFRRLHWPLSEALYLLGFLGCFKSPSNVYYLSLRFRRPSPA